LRTTTSLGGLTVNVNPRDNTPQRRAGEGLRFGVGEVIELTVAGLPATYDTVAWSVRDGAAPAALRNSDAGGGAATFTAPDVGPGAGLTGILPTSYPVTLELKLKRTATSEEESIATVVFDVVRPSTGRIKKHVDRHRARSHPASPGPNAGMWGMFMIGPVDVSFQNVLFKEGRGENVAPATLAGGIANTMASYANAYPNGHAFSGNWMTPGSTEAGHPAYDPAYGTRMGIWDTIHSQSPGTPSGGWTTTGTDTTVVGRSDCSIDWHYTVRAPGGDANPAGTGRKFCVVTHSASVTKDGTLTVSKGEQTVTKRWADPSEPIGSEDAGW
jgi:hypothetical protein